jgi:glutathione S-transferase
MGCRKMALTLYSHPLASFCHKVLIALYENGTPFESRMVDFADPGSAAALFDRWPVGKIPVLHDERSGRVVPETSIIIDYLQTHHPGPVTLLPEDAEAQLEVRLWDRFYDLYVSVPMQKIVADRLRPEDVRDPHGVREAREALDVAYTMITTRMQSRRWAAGEAFSMADCAAVPALFYAGIIHPFGSEHGHLAAYYERLLQRASVRRVLAEARPYFRYFPFRDMMPARYLEDL